MRTNLGLSPLKSIFPALVLAVSVSLLPAAPIVSAATAAGVVAPAVPPEEDVPSLSLPTPSMPADPARSIDTLTDSVADVPKDGDEVVEVGDGWTGVPGQPVEIRVDPDAPPLDPDPITDPTLDAPPVDEPTDSPRVDTESDTDAPAPSTSPSAAAVDEPDVVTETATADIEGDDLSADVPPVEVTVDKPADLGSALMILSLDDASNASTIPEVEEPAVEVRLSYEQFSATFGGGWGDRLQVVAFPECYTTTPDVDECAQGTIVPIENDTETESAVFTTASAVEAIEEQELPTPNGELPAGRVAAKMALAAAPASGGVVYAVTAGSGSFGSTSTPLSSEWQVGEGSGEFSYSYDFDLPKAMAGATPSLALNYSSASVDGMSLSENGQASMAGLGWDLSTSYVTRSFASCSIDGLPNVGDLCWKTTTDGELVEDLRIVLNGRSDMLIPVTTNTFRLRNDPGWKVERVDNTTADADVDNADNNDEAFKVSTPDGSVYWFGKGHGSESVATVPVIANNPDEPCRADSDNWCRQAWKWGLDRMDDSAGNVTRLEYEKDQNYYGFRGNANATVEYDREIALKQINYSYPRNGTENARNNVAISRDLRCTTKLTNPNAVCTGSNGPRANPSIWPDVPGDLLCDSGDSCDNFSPSFFSTKRYSQVVTKTVPDGTSGKRVDEYTLAFTMPDPDQGGNDQPDLWLDEIRRSGISFDGIAKAMPPVQLTGVALQNRVEATGNQRTLKKYRVRGITTEGGGMIWADYGHADSRECTPNYVGTVSRWESNRECFQQKFGALGNTPEWEWFHKYVVTRVWLGDRTLGVQYGATSSTVPMSKLRVFDYEYSGAPAWRRNTSRNTPTEDETWADWRGYEKTVIHTRYITDTQSVGTGDRARRVIIRFRGMNGTYKNPSGERFDNLRINTATIANDGDEELDSKYLNGSVAEVTSQDGGGTALTRTYTKYTSLLTAEHPVIADARMVFPSVVDSYDFQGTNKQRRVAYSYDEGGTEHRSLSAGSLLETTDYGFEFTNGVTGDETCTTQSWTESTTAWHKRPRATKIYGEKCSPSLTDADRLRQTVTYYDGQEGNASLQVTSGLATAVDTIVLGGSSSATIRTKATYDTFGRPATTTDGNGNLTTITYKGINNAANDVLKTVETKNAKNQVSSITVSSQRGQPVSMKDANAATTNLAYDELGRLSEVRYPGVSASDAPSIGYRYRLTGAASDPAWVSTRTPKDGGGLSYSYAYFDGWGRSLQTTSQKATPSLGRVIDATYYDDQGHARLTFNQGSSDQIVDSDTAPGLYYIEPADMYRRVENTYDPLGRVTASREKSLATERSVTTTAYSSTATTVVPPAPLDKTVTTSDAAGRAVKVQQYIGTSVGDTASYTYNAVGDLKQVTKKLVGSDSASGTDRNWLWAYDMAGRKVSATDPDTGTSTYEYDKNSNLKKTTDALSTQVITTYDALNRPLTRVAGGDQDTSWTYDSVAPNGVGRLSEVTQETPKLDGSTGYESTTSRVDSYDTLGNPTSTTTTFPGEWIGKSVAQSYQVTSTYDQSGRLKTQALPQVSNGATIVLPSRTISTSYTTNDLVSSMTSGSTTLAKVDYTQRNQVMSVVSGQGVPGAADFDGASALSRAYGWDAGGFDVDTLVASAFGSSSADLGLDYNYDAAGNPLAVFGTLGSGTGATRSCWAYRYDGMGRLTQADTGTSVLDGAGLPTSCTDTGVATTSVTGEEFGLKYAYQGDRLDYVSNVAGTNKVSYAVKVTGANRPHAPLTTSLAGSTFKGAPSTGDLLYDSVGRVTSWDPSGTTPATLSTYDSVGNLVRTVTGSASTTQPTIRHAYDSAGMRVARRTTTGAASNAWKTTVFLGGTELTYDATATSLTGLRQYGGSAGTPLATETYDPAAPAAERSKWSWLFADAQGNVRLAKDANTKAISRFNYYPFGQPITAVSALPSGRGFLNKTHDLNGDVRLDNRSYTPALNTLTTPDPLLRPGDPQSFNPYAYARNNPVTFADPSGLDPTAQMHDLGDTACKYNNDCDGDGYSDATGLPIGSAADDEGNGTSGEETSTEAGNTQELGSDLAANGSSLNNPRGPGYSAAYGTPQIVCVTTDACNEAYNYLVEHPNDPAGAIARGLSFCATHDCVLRAHLEDLIVGGEMAALGGGLAFGGPGGPSAAAKTESSLARTCLRSFSGATLVLMADGTKKPIEDVKVGDKVVATAPETGERVTRKVTHVWVHDDTLTDLRLADGAVLTTTEDHLFWSVSDQTFERADHLAAGEVVRGDNGREVVVRGFTAGTEHTALAYNLSIAGVHTYHVGSDAILVHNDCGPTLIYEANSKHGAVSRPGPRGEISRAPRGDCQAMLECSTLIKTQLRESVEPESGLTVIFRRHREFDGTEWWHGYVPGG